MSGEFKLDKAHSNAPDHLDHIQPLGLGALKERFNKDGQLIDVRFQPSNDFAEELGIETKNYILPKDISTDLLP